MGVSKALGKWIVEGATVVLPVTRNHSLKSYASTGVHTRTGTDFGLTGMAWQVRWGGGI